jgi:hypothetical protein
MKEDAQGILFSISEDRDHLEEKQGFSGIREFVVF